jgi:hypothetical protein
MRKKRKARLHPVDVCADCYVFSITGSVIMAEIDRPESFLARYRKAEESHGGILTGACLDPDHHDVITGEHFMEASFSKAPCDWCGSSLGGNRFCAAFREVDAEQA